ncbi:hypothetical protein [Tahibacter amnicola]|uniref:Uncharacterized protein n=1 Tax=Tahibacter amnicola TaxID=2976241 RepID=A0ABY6B8H1_9GAMM|nr:hypothetical protein [Tahibacter amnicola]UXI65806.1 hypothetical protein N4264_13635 [Tahibacter amnicola]
MTRNGSIAAGGSVTITITATTNTDVTGQIVSQGTFLFGADGNGTNETAGLTDDPSQGGSTNVTGFVVTPTPPGALCRTALFDLLALVAVTRRRAGTH